MPKKVTLHPELKDGFDQPQVVSDALLAFPADLEGLLPPMESIPEPFRSARRDNKWVSFMSDWFFSGWPERPLHTRPDVDGELAYRHLSTILGSYEPKHEHKEAAVSWLLSRWFSDVSEKK